LVLLVSFCDDPALQDRVLEPAREGSSGAESTSDSAGTEASATTLRDSVLSTFRGEIGVAEEGGENQGPRIAEYLATTGLGPGYAWCAALCSWGFTQHDIENPQSAWSPDWFPPQRTIYRAGEGNTHWKPVDVIGLYFHSKGRIAHVGVIDTVQGNVVITIEGNTNDYSTRDGDRVMRRRRYKRQIHAVSRYVHDQPNTISHDRTN
jgi:hypothetical protein